MKKQLISIRRLSWALLMGGALLFGTSACSTGTGDGDVNVEESDYKDKSATEHNPSGLSDNTEDNDGQPTPGAHQSDTLGENVYDKQQKEDNALKGKPSGAAASGAERPVKDN